MHSSVFPSCRYKIREVHHKVLLIFHLIVVLAGHLNDLRVLYSQNKTPSTSSKKNARHIPQVPERILDAPDLIDDYCKFSKNSYII